MIRDPITAEEVLRRVHAIGDSYGFIPLTTLTEARRGTKSTPIEPPVLPQLDPIAETVSSFLRQIKTIDLPVPARQPLFIWHSNVASGRQSPKHTVIQFHALGTERPIADVVVIRAMRALVQDLTKEEPVVHINTLGDKETRARFARELSNFFKKRGSALPEDCQNCAKKDVFEAADMVLSRACGETLPSPTDHLSDQSRKRFEELLEYLETTETPYELAPSLMSRGAIWSEMCFEIRDKHSALVWGSRYSDLAKMHLKTHTPAIGAVLRIETNGEKVSPVKRPLRTRFAFVHIGEEAKRESMKLADELRRTHLPLWQVIGVESLTEQMAYVEKLNPPFLLIMGRKEALEHSAVLRNRMTQEETVIPILELTERLRTFI